MAITKSHILGMALFLGAIAASQTETGQKIILLLLWC